MSKKNKNNTINLKNVIAKSNMAETTETWNGLEITITKTLSLRQMLTFVDNVTKTCFSEDTGEYRPEVKDFSIKSCILEFYTDIALPDDVEERYQTIYNSDIINFVIKHINVDQLREITNSIEDKIDNIAQQRVEMVNMQINELYQTFNNLYEQISQTFSGVTSEDINDFVKALSGMQLDEEKLVKEAISQRRSGSKVVSMPERTSDGE